MDIVESIRSLINKDNTKENQANSINVLVRTLSCIDIIYTLAILAIFIIKFMHIKVYLLVAAFVVLYLCIISFSYSRKYHRVGIILYCISYTIEMIVLTILLGSHIGFHMGCFSVIMIVFYDVKQSGLNKMIVSVIISLVAIASWSYAERNEAILPSSFNDIYLLSILSMILQSCIWIVIANMYYKKFSKSEEKILKYTDKLEKMSLTDGLTGLGNRRRAYAFLDKLIEDKKVITLVMCDIDKFKNVNDTYGHDIGDVVLKRVANILSTYTKSNGITVRWGGEEFLIILKDVNGDNAKELIENIRMMIARETFFVTDSKMFYVTMTFGISEYDYDSAIDDCIKEADNKLYIGKGSGRNKIIF